MEYRIFLDGGTWVRLRRGSERVAKTQFGGLLAMVKQF